MTDAADLTFPAAWCRDLVVATPGQHFALAATAVRSHAPRVAVEALRFLLDAHLPNGSPDYRTRAQAGAAVRAHGLEDLV